VCGCSRACVLQHSEQSWITYLSLLMMLRSGSTLMPCLTHPLLLLLLLPLGGCCRRLNSRVKSGGAHHRLWGGALPA